MASLITLPAGDQATGSRWFHPWVGTALLATLALGVGVCALLLGPAPALVATAWLVMAACAGYAVSGST